MYFKINPTGCGEYKGLVEVRFDCYLSREDPGNEEHYVTVPIFPAEGYPGKVDAFGHPVNLKDWETWVKSLPTETRNNPFCCHFRCFEPDVTDAQILAAGDEILAMAFANHQAGDLRKNKNAPVEFSTNVVKIVASQNRAESIKTADYTKLATELSVDSNVRA